MKKIFSRMLLPLTALALIFGSCGCEVFEEALDASLQGSENPNSDDYRPRFVVGIFSIVHYPQAMDLEKPIRDLDGKEIYINTNQNFSSKNLKDVKIVFRPGNPEICDLKFKLDRRGRIQWELLAGKHRYEQVAFVVDGRLISRFIPEFKADDESSWVFVRVGIDHFHARNIVKFAKKNYIFFNPDASNFFSSFR